MERTIVFHFVNKGTLKLINYDVSVLIFSVYTEEILLEVISVYLCGSFRRAVSFSELFIFLSDKIILKQG